MPAYHVYFLLRAWKWLAFDCGVVAATEMAVARWNARGKRRIQKDTAQAVVVVLFVAALYPRYLGREAFREAPRISRQISLADERRLHDWIREHTHLDAVFLADDIDALTLVGPLGRAVVSVPPAFFNPYVGHRMRATARDRMINALENGDAGLLVRALFSCIHPTNDRRSTARLVRAAGSPALGRRPARTHSSTPRRFSPS